MRATEKHYAQLLAAEIDDFELLKHYESGPRYLLKNYNHLYLSLNRHKQYH